MSADLPIYGMEPLATLPVFLKLQGAVAVMAGGDAPAAWKAELLAAAGASVRVHAEAPSPEMIELAGRTPQITLIERRWERDDLKGAAVAIGAIEGNAEAEAFRQAAKAAGVPVNVIDKPAFCDFQFGTIVARSPLVIGISTDGAAPVFGQAIRARIEALLPQSLREWADAARRWRPAVQARGFDFKARRRFWESFAEQALAGEASPTPAAQAKCYEAAEGAQASQVGQIWLVGSGPGRPGTMTLEAIAALQSADVIVHDADVQATSIGLSRREAPKLAVDEEQASHDHVRTLAEGGRRVAWLGTGSPGVCARWARRESMLAASAVPLTPIPGLALCPLCPDHCRYPAA